MGPRIHTFLAAVGAMGLVVAFTVTLSMFTRVPLEADNHQLEIVLEQENFSLSEEELTSVEMKPSHSSGPERTQPTTEDQTAGEPEIAALESKNHDTDTAANTTIAASENLYLTASFPFPTLVPSVQMSVVNIFCISNISSSRATTGSGVIIDPRGIILTNAHIAQYFLLAEHSPYPTTCTIRSGSPARVQWRARLLFFPHAWAEVHARDLLTAHPVGTGEHDYALLVITESLDNTPLPATFPFTPFDVRDGSVFPDFEVLITAYPAEFSSTATVQQGLYTTSVITTIKRLLTFVTQTVDLISLGSSAVAQGGSSGGAVVNQWGYLVGLIATTSEGETTGGRDLRAITLAHINRSLSLHIQQTLLEFFSREMEEVRLSQQEQQKKTATLFVDVLKQASL